MPATKRWETFRPTAERSAKCRRRRLSERAMKRARNKRRAFYIRSAGGQVRIAVGSGGFGHCDRADASGTAGQENLSTRAEGLAGRADVIDEEYRATGRGGTRAENSPHVFGAGGARKAGLGFLLRRLAEQARIAADFQPARQRTGQKLGLVVAAAAQLGTAHRNRHDRVKVEIPPRAHDILEQSGEGIIEKIVTLKLEGMKNRFETSAVFTPCVAPAQRQGIVAAGDAER